jgi:arylsulfatase A-like enzyme
MLFLAWAGMFSCTMPEENPQPNIVLIYADDLGYGDVGAYGSKVIETPNVDRLAGEGLLFTNAHASSATCTPSRFALLTGQYPWRREGTGIAPGDATMIIPTTMHTTSSILKSAGYNTAVVGKWHLGLGPKEGADWNGEIRPGPEDIGFDYAFLIPATGDRVPCVYVENRRVVGLAPEDPIQVSFGKPIGDEPTGKDHPELLKMHPSHGHNQTIINGISRIGYMTGGKAARWVDEDMADVITERAKNFMQRQAANPFFLYFSTHDIHVPRVPHERFVGKSGLGGRGDAIVQFDWCVGQILDQIDELGLKDNTLVILTSDNGPVVDDGYHDQSVEMLDGHKPWGPLRGGKYSAFDAGTRVPFIVRWPGKVRPGLSGAMVSQVDLMASLAGIVGADLPEGAGPDSFNESEVILGRSDKDRDFLIEHAAWGTLSIIQDGWKYIEPSRGARYNRNVDIELGNDTVPQLYNLVKDLGEQQNLAEQEPTRTKELSDLLEAVKKSPASKP